MVKQGRFQQVKVKNGSEWTFKSAHNLVPGDVILIHTNQILPADCVLLTGEVLVNESTLTGEAAAMAKDRVKNHDKNKTFPGQNFTRFGNCSIPL